MRKGFNLAGEQSKALRDLDLEKNGGPMGVQSVGAVSWRGCKIQRLRRNLMLARPQPLRPQ